MSAKNLSVCFITPRAKRASGGEESMFSIIEFLQTKDINVKVVTLEEQGTLLDALDKLHIAHRFISGELWVNLPWQKHDPLKFNRILKQAKELAFLLKKWKVDVVYTNTSVLNLGAIAAGIIDKSHIWHIRESIKDNINYSPIIPFEDEAKFINLTSNNVVYISKYLREQYDPGLKNQNAEVIYNRLDVNEQVLKPVDPNIKVDVVVAFYKDESILQCLESLKKHKSKSLNKVIIMDDRGPDLPLAERVKAFVKKNADLFDYVQNEENKGLVITENRAMKLTKYDVILLNSDTIVTENWLEKMKTNIYQSADFATTTCLANSASYYSIPDQFHKEFDNDPELMNKIVEKFSTFKYIQTHTSHGFCMYVKRSTIDKIGLLDEDAFGKGYGEEVDYSMRALSKGLKNIVSTNTYIHHWEGRSFGILGADKKKEIKKKTKIILKRYPNLHILEREFHERNEMEGVRRIANAFKNVPEIVDAEKLVVLGSIEENKGQMDALELLIKLHNEGGKQHLIFVGPYDESPYVQKLKELTKKNKLDNYVHFLGYIFKPWEIIKSAKAVINPSRNEGFGRFPLETMLLKTPLISTRSGGLAEFVANETAYVFEPGNIGQLYKAYKELEKDKGARVAQAFNKANEIQNINDYEKEVYEIILKIKDQENAGRKNINALNQKFNWLNSPKFTLMQQLKLHAKYSDSIYGIWKRYKNMRVKLALGTRIKRRISKLLNS